MKKQASSSGAFSGAGKWFTWVLTTTAALTALLVNARNLGLAPWLGVDLGFATHAATRVVVAPRAESLFAIGDTVVLAATVTDRRGTVLTGAQLIWHAEDTNVVDVDSSGAVIARGPGVTRVTARVRDLTASAMVTVVQHPTRVIIAGDSAVKIKQGDTVQLAAVALDARGHRIGQATPRWRTGDSLVVSVDSLGTAIGRSPGRARLWATAGDGGGEVTVEVELTATALTVASGDGQRALAGRRVGDPIVLKALGKGGQAVPGATVSFGTSDGEGLVEPNSATADRDGRVRVNWTLSPHPGPQRLLARLSTTDTVFSVSADADPVPGNTHVELVGTPPSGRVGTALGQPVIIRYTDTTGAALASVPVAWTLLDGGALEASPRTDSLGVAKAHWVLGPRAGPQRLLAQVGNPRTIPAFTLAATALAGPPAAIAVQSGEGQRGTVGGALPKPIVLQLRDSLGNPLSGVAISVRTAQGTVADTDLVTNQQGRAVVRWTLGPTAGDQQVEVRVDGLDGVTRLTAHAAAGNPTKVILTGLTQKNGPAGALNLIATVTDDLGNPVQGVSVGFSATGGRLSATRSRTDAAGRASATWTSSSTLGEQRITAVVSGTRATATQVVRGSATNAKRRS
jgi:hypothetical protein